MKTTRPRYLELTGVEYEDDYKLEVCFNDGVRNTIDFEPFLRRTMHPSIKKYLNLNKFKGFTFEFGHLQWNDYDLSFSNDDLYEGRIL